MSCNSKPLGFGISCTVVPKCKWLLPKLFGLLGKLIPISKSIIGIPRAATTSLWVLIQDVSSGSQIYTPLNRVETTFVQIYYIVNLLYSLTDLRY